MGILAILIVNSIYFYYKMKEDKEFLKTKLFKRTIFIKKEQEEESLKKEVKKRLKKTEKRREKDRILNDIFKEKDSTFNYFY